MKQVIILLLILSLTACNNNQDKQQAFQLELIEKEKALIEKEKDLIEKEKENLKNQANIAIAQKELLTKDSIAAKKLEKINNTREQQNTKNEEYLNEGIIKKYYEMEDLVGTWNVNMKATMNNCDVASIDDIRSEIWVISYEKNQVVARKSSGGTNTANEYKGIFDFNDLELENVKLKEKSTKVTVNLNMKSTRLLVGERVVSNPVPCSIMYDIELKKQ